MRAEVDDAYLVGEGLRTTFAGATLLGNTWVEYYATDGTIVGKFRYLGFVREFAGRWIAKHDHVCFEYARTEANTCSKFRRRGERIFHYGFDDKPKRDPESLRFVGNRLDAFK
jgi:hypothetical protein